jgi:hypothetical protein
VCLTYRVLIKRKVWEQFEQTAPAAVVQAAKNVRDNYLRISPLDPARAPGKTKKLAGKLAGLIQYDLPAYHRLWYRVDEAACEVRVEYVGPHP